MNNPGNNPKGRRAIYGENVKRHCLSLDPAVARGLDAYAQKVGLNRSQAASRVLASGLRMLDYADAPEPDA